MFSFVFFGALLTVSSVSGFGGCGCRQEPPPCYQEPPPSCGQPEVCTPCPPPPAPPPCPICPPPQIPQCPTCPAPPQPPPCPVCPPIQVCEVCEVCPPQVVPEPCPQCPAPPPPPQCPACPVPPPPPPPQPCPAPPPPPRCGGYRRPHPPPPQYPSNDCCNQCGNSCFFQRRLRMHGAATMVVDVDPTCNSEKLRTIILNNISADITESKRAIQKEANGKLTAHYDVICAKGDFSYVISSNQFCQETKDDVTCYVFRA